MSVTVTLLDGASSDVEHDDAKLPEGTRHLWKVGKGGELVVLTRSGPEGFTSSGERMVCAYGPSAWQLVYGDPA